MSRNKNKSKSEVEHLRGENKRLQKINRSLRRENKGLKNRAHFYEETIDEVADDIVINDEMCQECGKGVITEHDFTYIIVKSCDTCEYKERIKPRKK